MLLSDVDIKQYISEGKVSVKPRPLDMDLHIGTCSLDLRLGREFRVFKYSERAFIDTADPDSFKGFTTLKEVPETGSFVVQPNNFVLGVTKEYIELPDDIAARFEGRSSLGRLGIVVHSTAGHIDAGWRGQITLEIANIGNVPIVLHPGMRICQLVFEKLVTPTSKPYYKDAKKKYAKDTKPGESRLDKEIVKTPEQKKLVATK